MIFQLFIWEIAYEPAGSISDNLKEWITQKFSVNVQVLPYHVENGGIFLKDAAVLAGLGIIGKNNLLVTPAYGPRVRLRFLRLGIEADPTGPMDDYFSCENCGMHCQAACPQNTFADKSYSHRVCLIQMRKDRAHAKTSAAADAGGTAISFVKYCRKCEIVCPEGTR